MLGVFAAYFVTIVIFAGLYLTVNKVGERYNSDGGVNPNGLDVSVREVSGGDNNGILESDIDMADVSSFCGMDINNHMEGEFVLFGLLLDLLWDWIVCVFDLSVVSLVVLILFLQILCVQHFTLASPQWQQSVTAPPTTTLANAGHPSS